MSVGVKTNNDRPRPVKVTEPSVWKTSVPGPERFSSIVLLVLPFVRSKTSRPEIFTRTSRALGYRYVQFVTVPRKLHPCCTPARRSTMIASGETSSIPLCSRRPCREAGSYTPVQRGKKSARWEAAIGSVCPRSPWRRPAIEACRRSPSRRTRSAGRCHMPRDRQGDRHDGQSEPGQVVCAIPVHRAPPLK